MVGLNLSLEKMQVVDRMQSYLKNGAGYFTWCFPRLGLLQAGLSSSLSVMYGRGAVGSSVG